MKVGVTISGIGLWMRQRALRRIDGLARERAADREWRKRISDGEARAATDAVPESKIDLNA